MRLASFQNGFNAAKDHEETRTMIRDVAIRHPGATFFVISLPMMAEIEARHRQGIRASAA